MDLKGFTHFLKISDELSPLLWFGFDYDCNKKDHTTLQPSERINTSLVYLMLFFLHIAFLVQHIGNASGGKTQCNKKKVPWLLKENLT